jgi:DNA-binding CsgD family transcriptional regulator
MTPQNTQPDVKHMGAMLNSVPANIYIKNKDGVYTEINYHSLHTMHKLGFIPKPHKKYIIGKSDFELFHREIANEFHRHDMAILEGSCEACFQEKNITNEGVILRHISIKKPMYAENGLPLGVIGVTLTIESVDKENISEIMKGLLSAREAECLEWYFQGKTSKETASILGISHRTIEEYFTNIKEKLGCKNKRDLLARLR